MLLVAMGKMNMNLNKSTLTKVYQIAPKIFKMMIQSLLSVNPKLRKNDYKNDIVKLKLA